MSNKPTLISVNKELLELTQKREEILIQCEGELTPEIETELKQIELSIMGLLTQNKDKVTSYCAFLDSLEIEKAYCKQRIKEVEKYVNRLEKTQEWLLGTAKYIIDSNGKDLEGHYGNKIFLKKSTSVEVTDLKLLPPNCVNLKVEKTPDKNAIKDFIKKGFPIQGAKLVEKFNPSWK
jgi:hypothetical protein